ncbi:MAG: glycosyltransferase family 39 protein [Phycisphaerae bacterium]
MASDRPTRQRRIERIAAALTVVIVPAVLTVAGWTTQEFPARADRYLFAQNGETILDGGTVYRDCWNNKPPGMTWLNAAVLLVGARSTYAVTLAAILAGLAAVGVTAWALAQVFGRGIAVVATLMFTVLLAQRSIEGVTNGAEFYTMVADAFAAVLAIGSMARQGRAAVRWALLAGACWGVAGLMKQTGAAGPMAAGLAALLALLVGPVRFRWLARCAVMGAGAAVVVGIAAAVLYWQGALADAYHASVTYNLDLLGGGWAAWWPRPSHFIYQAKPLAWVLLPAALGAIVTYAPDSPPPQPQARPADTMPPRPRASLGRTGPGSGRLPRVVVAFLVIWFIVALYGVGLGSSHMPRYWHGVFIPMIWLVAQGLRFIAGACRTDIGRNRWTVRAGVIVLAASYLPTPCYNVYADAIRAYHYAHDDSERRRLADVGRRIADLTQPDDEIYVWAYQPGVYRYAHRRAACRFAGLDKVATTHPNAGAIAREIADTLRDRRPKLIAVAAPRLAELRDDYVRRIRIDGLNDWFEEHYEETDRIHGFVLFLRQTETDPSILRDGG